MVSILEPRASGLKGRLESTVAKSKGYGILATLTAAVILGIGVGSTLLVLYGAHLALTPLVGAVGAALLVGLVPVIVGTVTGLYFLDKSR